MRVVFQRHHRLAAIVFLCFVLGWIFLTTFGKHAAVQPVAVAYGSELTQQSYSLVDGWNFISFPFQPVSIKRASELVSSVNADGGFVTMVSKWDGDHWQELAVREGTVYGNDFLLNAREAYFVLNHQEVEWNASGTKINARQSLPLHRGWNAIGLTQGSYPHAEAVIDGVSMNNVEAVTEIDRWLSGNWDVFVKRTYSASNIQNYGNNFPIDGVHGYMIKANQATELKGGQ
jgi:hypothetical protein